LLDGACSTLGCTLEWGDGCARDAWGDGSTLGARRERERAERARASHLSVGEERERKRESARESERTSKRERERERERERDRHVLCAWEAGGGK